MTRSRGGKRFAFVAWVMIAGFVLAGASQARVSLLSRSEILENALDSSRYMVKRLDYAKRGTIYSSDGKILAQSEDTYRLGINYAKVPRSPGFFMALGVAANIPASELQQAGYSGKNAIWQQVMSADQAAEIQRVKITWRADGVSLDRMMHRDYPLGIAGASILGEVKDGRPIAGLEASQNKILKGQDGYQEGLVDKTGAFLPMRMSETSKTRINGANVTLTIDSTLQVAAQNCIKTAVISNRAERGVALIYDPSTGRILAMANWPTFDPEADGWNSGVNSTFNPCTMGAYEPGSTFKILTLAEALNKGVVHDGDTVNCTGEYAINSAWKVHCDMHHGNRAHGLVDLQRAIAKSCNVSAAKWALKVGYPAMTQYLDDLGLLEKTHLGLPLERKGMFNRHDYAKALQIANVGFGQALTATPVALISAFGMLANGGIRMEPQLIKDVAGVEQRPKESGRIVKSEVADKVMRLMEAVIQTDAGTGKRLRIPGYRLAGKTGTAQKLNPKTGKMGGGGNVSSFVGFVPAGKPKAVILVMVDHPTAGKIYGADVAGPVFLELAQTLIRYYQIPPNAIAAAPKAQKPKKGVAAAAL